MSTRSLLIAISAFLLGGSAVIAQEEPSAFGAYGHWLYNMHVADFQQLPGVPNCCPRFEEGTGYGISAGAFYQFPLSERLFVQLRAGYRSMDGVLTRTEETTVLHEGVPSKGEFTHRLESFIGAAGLEPLLGLRIVGNLRLHLGLDAGMLTMKEYHQREEITRPEGAGTFLDASGNDSRSRVRNEFSGEIPGASAFQMAALGGISYALPLNSARTLILAPEAFYSVGLTPVAENLKWEVNSLRVGLSITSAPRPEELPPPPPVVERDTLTPKPLPALSARVGVMGVEPDGVERPIVRMVVEEFSSRLMTPLLNYLFFDENSATIPDRYQRLTPGTIDTFVIDRINSPLKLPTYHHLMNIVGRRMLDHPQATLTLTGCNQDIREEKGDIALSRKRAEVVRDYLIDVWGIPEHRIKIEARNLSTHAANTLEQDGSEENRRVEFTSDDPRILFPIITNDTLRRSNIPVVRFHPGAMAEAGVGEWRLVATQRGDTLKRFEGSGEIPTSLDWNLNDASESLPRTEDTLYTTLTVRDSTGQRAHASGSIPIEQLTIRRKQVEMRGDIEIGRFSLILFEVRSAEISRAAAGIVPLIKSEIRSTSSVEVTGYTDRLGELDYNQQLAEDRATSVAKALVSRTENRGRRTEEKTVASITSKGIGEADLYDASLPEGRLYTRTVDIVVETPVGVDAGRTGEPENQGDGNR